MACSGRADRVARIVLTQPEAWDWLSAEDHQLLAQSPSRMGRCSPGWSGRGIEHGPQPWAALREALRGQPFEALALELNAGGLALQRPEDEDPSADVAQPSPPTSGANCANCCAACTSTSSSGVRPS